MHKTLGTIALTLFLLLLASPAFADDIQTFSLSLSGSGLPQALSPSSTIVIDTTTGTVVSQNLSLADGTLLKPSPFPPTVFASVMVLNDFDLHVPVNASTVTVYDFRLFLPVTTLVGYSGGPLCSAALPCVSAGITEESETFILTQSCDPFLGCVTLSSTKVFLGAGSLTPVSSPVGTPEPPALALLAVPLLALWRMCRGKLPPVSPA